MIALSFLALVVVAAAVTLGWENSSDGVHSFLTMDTAYTNAERARDGNRFDFVWGGSNPRVWHSANKDMVVSGYTPYAWDCGWGGNISWWQEHHPDWILYKCDKKTPAWYAAGRTDCVPFDVTNPEAVSFHIARVVDGFRTSGYDAVAADMFYLENDFGACGVWRSNSEAEQPQWVQLYTGSSSDRAYEAAQIGWAKRFRAALHNNTVRALRLIPNYSLLGRKWDDGALQSLLENVDGILDEQGFSNYGSMFNGAGWANVLHHQTNVQRKGAAYYSINEVHNTSDHSTRRWLVGSYLMGRNNASALFMSAPQDYGEVVPHRPEFDAPVGVALGPATQMAPFVFVREFSKAIVCVHTGANGTAAFELPLDQRNYDYVDVYGNGISGTRVEVTAGDAAILLRTNRQRSASLSSNTK